MPSLFHSCAGSLLYQPACIHTPPYTHPTPHTAAALPLRVCHGPGQQFSTFLFSCRFAAFCLHLHTHCTRTLTLHTHTFPHSFACHTALRHTRIYNICHTPLCHLYICCRTAHYILCCFPTFALTTTRTFTSFTLHTPTPHYLPHYPTPSSPHSAAHHPCHATFTFMPYTFPTSHTPLYYPTFCYCPPHLPV